jgi:two-component sensor histidine kinase
MNRFGRGPPSPQRALTNVRRALTSRSRVPARHDVAVEQDALQLKLVADSLADQLADRDTQLVEVNHRVKNNLQLITSLLAMQMAKIDDAAAQTALKETMNQVAVLGLIHDELNVSGTVGTVDFCISLVILCRYLNQAYGNLAEIEVEVGVGDCSVDATTAIRLALVVNEIMTNALKHAFPDGRRGRILVRLHRAKAVNLLTIADDGIGLAANHVKNTGFKLIGMLSQAIKGSLSCEPNPTGGTLFQLAF